MSQSGNYTPLQLNVLSALSNNSGLAINDLALKAQGTWTPTQYIQGTVTNSTVLWTVGTTSTDYVVYS